MQLQIRKRTGELALFDKEKIETAICKAWHDVYPKETGKPSYASEIADMIETVAQQLVTESNDIMGVEDIQELVEDY